MARTTFASSMRAAAQRTYEKYGVCNNYCGNLPNTAFLGNFRKPN
ncbi:MAG: hypothetical protein ACPGKR_07360 [Poseidonia sp.]